MSFHPQGIHVACAEPQLERKPIAWLVASLFALAPFTWAEESRAQTLTGMRSHTSVSEWAVGPAPAAVTDPRSVLLLPMKRLPVRLNVPVPSSTVCPAGQLSSAV